MGKALAEAFPAAREVFARVDAALGESLSKLIFEGPEAELTLAHATIYIATAPKSNSATLALGAAKAALAGQPVQSVPVHLRDKGGQASKRMGHGQGYLYSHEFPEAISGQEFLEKPLALYAPKPAGTEAAIAERLAAWKKLKAGRQGQTQPKP